MVQCQNQNFACWVKLSADNILKYLSCFSLKIGFDTSCKFSAKETICMMCQILLSRKNKKNIVYLSSAEYAHSVVSVNEQLRG